MVKGGDMVDHPTHYNQCKYETIEEMVMLFGKKETAIFCKLNAYKYKARAMFKHDDGGKEDLQKADWYLTEYLKLTGVNCVEKSKEVEIKCDGKTYKGTRYHKGYFTNHDGAIKPYFKIVLESENENDK